MNMDEKEHEMEQQKIYRAHPRLYWLALAPEGERECMAWGLSVGIGWFPIIKRLSEQLDEIATRHGLSEDKWPRVVQVKEKFGQLRYVLRGGEGTHGTPVWAEIVAAKNAAETESLSVCERCGAPGEMRQGGWIHVYCDHCEALYKRDIR